MDHGLKYRPIMNRPIRIGINHALYVIGVDCGIGQSWPISADSTRFQTDSMSRVSGITKSLILRSLKREKEKEKNERVKRGDTNLHTLRFNRLFIELDSAPDLLLLAAASCLVLPPTPFFGSGQAGMDVI